jgi:type IV secretory pathway TrbD component
MAGQNSYVGAPPLAPPAVNPSMKTCPALPSTMDSILLGKAKKRLYMNYVLVAAFVIIFILCCWFIASNAVSIWEAYSGWKSIVTANRAHRSRDILYDPHDPLFDDEFYVNTRVTSEEELKDNESIRTRLSTILKSYDRFNKELHKAGMTGDEVDKTILAGEYDDYVKQPEDEVIQKKTRDADYELNADS